MIAKIVDFICDIGIDTLFEKGKGLYNKNELTSQLKAFVDKSKEQFEDVDRKEEFDFQGLSAFILHNLPNEIDSYIYSNSESQMTTAADTIINNAIEYAQANTIESQSYVRSLTMKCLQILHDFYVSVLFDNKDKLEISEIGKMISHDGNETRELIGRNLNNAGNNDGLNDRRVAMIIAIDYLKLPKYTREKIPKNEPANNPEISINEFNILFDDAQIQTQFKLLLSIFEQIEELIIDLKQFHSLCRKPDGEGGYICLLWEDIIEKESLIDIGMSNVPEQEFIDFCCKNELIHNRKAYNYYNITRKLENEQNKFVIVKDRTIALMKNYMKEILRRI